MRKFFMLISNLKMLLLLWIWVFRVNIRSTVDGMILTYFCHDFLHFSSYQHRIGRRAILEPYFEVKKRVLYAEKYGTLRP